MAESEKQIQAQFSIIDLNFYLLMYLYFFNHPIQRSESLSATIYARQFYFSEKGIQSMFFFYTYSETPLNWTPLFIRIPSIPNMAVSPYSSINNTFKLQSLLKQTFCLVLPRVWFIRASLQLVNTCTNSKLVTVAD